jgi:Undecaprenyl-phosphate glucose phosphotransferase
MENTESFKQPPFESAGATPHTFKSLLKFTSRLPYRIVKDLIRVSDGLVLVAASTIERLPEVQDLLTNTSDHNHLLANIVGGCITFGFLSTADGYKIRVLRQHRKQFKRIVMSVLAGTAGVFLSLDLMHHTTVELVTGPARWFVLSFAGLTVSRAAITPIMRLWADAGKLAKRVAVIGGDEATQVFINAARGHADTCKITGLYVDEAQVIKQGPVEVVGPVSQVFADSQADQFDAVVISQYRRNDLDQILAAIEPVIADVYVIAYAYNGAFSKDRISTLGGNAVVCVKPKPLSDWQIVQKAVLDRSVAAIALVCLSPLMLATAVAIQLDSKGPVFFRQPRDGYNNKSFTILKYRSMYKHVADLRADKQTTRGDPRITRVGKIIRKFSIDELPQLINVLRGDMSLVGPRPHAPGTKANGKLFSDVVANYKARHRVKPGITGLAQINGYRGDTPTEQSIIKRVEYDLKYMEKWSIWLDLKIIVLTVFREILSKKAF